MIAPRVVLGCVLVATALSLAWAAAEKWRVPPPKRILWDLADVSPPLRWSEMRIPGAGFARVRPLSGGTEVELGRSSRLLEIRAEIARKLEGDLEDPDWLQARGRSELLAGRPREAIQTLRAAADLGSDNADLWNDLGAAYYGLSVQLSSADEDTLAIEALGRAASLRDRDPAIHYNLGCALERLHIFDAAEENFRAALAEERDPDWKEDTRTRLDASFEERRRLFALPAGLEIPDTLEDRMERAFTEQIVAAWAGTGLASLRSTAQQLLDIHGDHWISEVVALAGQTHFSRCVQTLSEMARIRAKGRFDQYEQMAGDIASLREMVLPAPLAAWRDFELLFRASHGRDLRHCPATDDLVRSIERRGYRALEIQTLLESSTCQNGSGRLDDALESASTAARLADQYAYTSLALRAKGFLASDYVNEGRYREAYQISSDCLAEMLKDGMPIRRAHQFYHTIERTAERLEHWYTARASVQMAQEVAGVFGSSVYEMIAQCKRADYSARLRLWDKAETEYQEALRLYKRLPPNRDVQAYASAARAGVLESRKDYAGLLQLRHSMEDSANAFLEAPVDVALARIALDRHLPDEAAVHASRLIDWLGRQSVAADAEKNQFRKMLQRASVAKTRALLELRQPTAARDAWFEFLKGEARLLGGTISEAESGDAAVMTIADLDTGIGVWLKSRQGVDFHWATPDRRTALLQVRRLRRLCADAGTSQPLIRQAEAAVWRSLFAPALEQQSGIKRLRVQAEGEFTSIPLSLLMSDYQAAGMPSEVAFTPYPLASRATTQGPPVLVNASETNPHLEGLAPLPRAQAEIARVASTLTDARIIEGKDATATSIEGALGVARLFHFSGHAVQWRDSSVLAVAPDPSDARPEARAGILRITPEMRISPDLVSLWACSTGYGEDNETVSPSRLAEAALIAGARHVVGSLWNVDSAATSEFEARFYRLWGSGQAPGQALQRAASEVRELPDYHHPYYWAGFVLYQSEK